MAGRLARALGRPTLLWGSYCLPRLVCGGCISLALTCVERSDPQDRVGALVTRQNHASVFVHVDGQAPGLKHAQLC
jgi:hypothetical protein